MKKKVILATIFFVSILTIHKYSFADIVFTCKANQTTNFINATIQVGNEETIYCKEATEEIFGNAPIATFKVAEWKSTNEEICKVIPEYENVAISPLYPDGKKLSNKATIKTLKPGSTTIICKIDVSSSYGTAYASNFVQVIGITVEDPNNLTDIEEQREEDITFNDVLKDIEGYMPNDIDNESAGKIEKITSMILTSISNIGIALSVIILAAIGIKYMLGSIEEKAEYKKNLIPYVIGVCILFGITIFMRILMAIGEKIANS